MSSTGTVVRWRLHGDEREPTTRQRGLNVLRELQRQGADADAWDGHSPADVIVLQYDMRLLEEALRAAPVVIADINDMVWADHLPNRAEVLKGLDRVQAVVAGSPHLGRYLQRLHERVRVIEEAVDPCYFAVRSVAHEGLGIFWMGMHDNLAFLREADEALKILHDRQPFTLNVTCPPRNSRGRSNSAVVEAKPYGTCFRPWTPNTVLELMAISDIGIAPLFQNAWCWCKCANKPASMMAAGLPVVVSDVPSYRAVVDEGETGFLCSDPEDWMGAVEGLLSDAKLRRRLGMAARNRVAQALSIEQIAAQWWAFIMEVSG